MFKVNCFRMGSTSDHYSVVDSELKVLGGIEGLRVIDASVIPQLPAGKSGSPTMMIAERGSYFIKRDYNLL